MQRILNYSSFCLSAAFRVCSWIVPYVVIASSPTAGWTLRWWQRDASARDSSSKFRDCAGVSGRGCREIGIRLLAPRPDSDRFLPVSQVDHIVVVTSAFKGILIQHWKYFAGKIISVVETAVERSFTPRRRTI